MGSNALHLLKYLLGQIQPNFARALWMWHTFHANLSIFVKKRDFYLIILSYTPLPTLFYIYLLLLHFTNQTGTGSHMTAHKSYMAHTETSD